MHWGLDSGHPSGGPYVTIPTALNDNVDRFMDPGLDDVKFE